ncbi:uncharacterized protein LOC127242861 [Andrographis paniculata]|uniref:uncharacterized protein LOC127242861 n=1 Tax=Andrographis paniculata TaxID=175694 RepID=UPI0021E7D7A3|nr:uncharacterized protein LOC127242861 [Andrographis paniculata]
MRFPNYLLLLAVSAAAAAAAETPTAYEVLQTYDFPVGLLPKGVTGYEIDAGTGKFAVDLSKTCTFVIKGFTLKYKTKITGTIANDRITNLKGIQVKILILWLNIVEVTKTDRGDGGGELQFSVGVAAAGFPVSSFDESPQCGCGFKCNHRSSGFGRFPLLQL